MCGGSEQRVFTEIFFMHIHTLHEACIYRSSAASGVRVFLLGAPAVPSLDIGLFSGCEGCQVFRL